MAVGVVGELSSSPSAAGAAAPDPWEEQKTDTVAAPAVAGMVTADGPINLPILFIHLRDYNL
jgi:hypothetical protein